MKAPPKFTDEQIVDIFNRCCIEMRNVGVNSLSRAIESARDAAWAEALPKWRPIETAPKDDKSNYFFCTAAYGPDEDKSTGYAMRYKGEWFAALVFYNMGKHAQRQLEFREYKITPTHWMPLPPAPGEQE